MGYTRRFKKVIDVHYSGSKWVDASDTGKFVSYDGKTTETIYFDVFVDTDPFDESIDDMKKEVDLLTGSVVATEAAQVESVRDCSRQVGNTIISGFFKTVKSDISQQIAELKIKGDALLLQLNELAKRCRDKQRAMSVDYNRITTRYTKIFEELNKELENRIHSLDEPVFTFSRKSAEIENAAEGMVAVPSVSAAESARAQAQITAARTKNQAVDTIERARKFLEVQYKTDRLLNHCLMPGGENRSLDAPYCYIDAVSDRGINDSKVHVSRPLENVDAKQLIEKSSDLDFSAEHNSENLKKIESYYNTEMASIFDSGNSSHNQRVAALTKEFFNNFTTQS